MLGLVPIAFFLLWERHRDRVRRSALLDLSLFSLLRFSWGNVTAAIVAVGEFALIFVLPLYLVSARGLSVLQSGFVLAAMAIGAFIAGAQARHLAAGTGPPAVVLPGLVLEVAGIAVMAFLLDPSVSVWMMTIPLVVYGLGLGFASAQLTSLVPVDVPTSQSRQDSATRITVRQVGMAIGTAVAGAAVHGAGIPPRHRHAPGPRHPGVCRWCPAGPAQSRRSRGLGCRIEPSVRPSQAGTTARCGGVPDLGCCRSRHHVPAQQGQKSSRVQQARACSGAVPQSARPKEDRPDDNFRSMDDRAFFAARDLPLLSTGAEVLMAGS